MLVAVCGDKGAPGATTTAVAIATVWQGQRPVVVVEADAAGGDLWARCVSESGGPLAYQPNVLGLAAAVRGGGAPSPGTVAAYAQPTRSGMRVVPGFLSAESGREIVDHWAAVADACLAADVDVVADVGRVHSSSPAMPVVAAADAVIVVGLPTLDGVVHLRERVAHVGGLARGWVIPVVITRPKHAESHVREAAQILEAAGNPASVDTTWIAHDPAGVARLLAGQPVGRLARTPLLRSARVLATWLDRAPAEPAGRLPGRWPQ